MKIHLVGGCGGSGKTTAINNASKLLSEQNVAVSAIKDDQVDFVIDRNPAQKTSLAFARVTGGCSCCNYNQLDFQLNQLKNKSNPEVVFAEYSGTCTNLIKSLLNPFKELRREDIEIINFSTFVEAGLLSRYLQGSALPVSSENSFLLMTHVNEAEMLIINKTDLISQDDFIILQKLIKEKLCDKKVLFLKADDKESVGKWIDLISNPKAMRDFKETPVREKISILDEEIHITSENNDAPEASFLFMKSLSEKMVKSNLKIEHLNFYLSFNKKTSRYNYTHFIEDHYSVKPGVEKSDSVDLLINAHICSSPDKLRNLLRNELNSLKILKGISVKEKFISYSRD